MDVTNEYYINVLRKTKNRKDIFGRMLFRQAKRHLDLEISGLRMTMIKNKGKNVAGMCSHEANILERKMNSV